MNKTQVCVFVCILGFLLFCGESQSLAPYQTHTLYFPGNTYDLGTLTSADIIKANLTWVMYVDYGHLLTLKLYKISGGTATQVSINAADITYPAAKNLLYQGTTG